MRRALAYWIPLTLGTAPLGAQAPPSGEFWRVAATSLTQPAALQTGATAAFWNPAAAPGRSRLVVGAQLVQTSEILGLSGILAGVGQRIKSLQLGLVLGRMEVRDLVRTTTSPNSVAGSIPVYEQLAGAQVGVSTSSLRVGALLLLHDSRFDVVREGGVTLDVGFSFAPVSRVRVAGATHLFPIDLSRQETTDYYAGVEYVLAPSVQFAGTHARVGARYGTSYRRSGDLEHAFGLGIALDQLVELDAALTSESAFGERSWRPSLGVSLRIGRYTLAVARSSGLKDIGATYRVGLDIQVLQ